VKIIASIENPTVIERILAHLAAAPASTPEPAHPARGGRRAEWGLIFPIRTGQERLF
jgi:hypothetical protein